MMRLNGLKRMNKRLLKNKLEKERRTKELDAQYSTVSQNQQ